MKERPILFSAPMVRAILEGRKTQTRRVLKIQPNGQNRIPTKRKTVMNIADPRISGLCPWGQVGDRLWVKETHSVGLEGHIFYRATNHEDRGPWKPSIFMFRKYSRINLEIANIRVERLNDISEDDAGAEGVEICGIEIKTATPVTWKDYLGRTGAGFDSKVESFRSLWESINGPGSWDKNPYVWVVEFKVVTK